MKELDCYGEALDHALADLFGVAPLFSPDGGPAADVNIKPNEEQFVVDDIPLGVERKSV